jgi:hypothetical protein
MLRFDLRFLLLCVMLRVRQERGEQMFDSEDYETSTVDDLLNELIASGDYLGEN